MSILRYEPDENPEAINTLPGALRNMDKGPLKETQDKQAIEARIQALYKFLDTGGVRFKLQQLTDMQKKLETAGLSPEDIDAINTWREEALKMFNDPDPEGN